VRPRAEAVETVLRVGLIAAVAAFIVQGAVHVANVALDRRFELLDADSDYGVFAWTSALVTAVAAVLAFVLAARLRRRDYLLLGAALAAFALDDLIAVHERIGELDDELGLPHELQLRRLVWVVVLLPLLAAAAILLWRAAREAPRRAGTLVRGGLALLVLAVAAEATTPVLFNFDWGQDSIPYETEVVFEEGAELAGWILVATGLAGFATAAAAERPAVR
jgi:hypothetical protein